jgi:hypothetical protein
LPVSRVAEALDSLCVTAWVGALWGVGLIAVPTLFAALAERALASALAARMLMYVALLGVGCGLYLVAFRLARFGGHALRQAFFWVAVLMLLLTLLGQFGAQAILDGLKPYQLPYAAMEGLLRERFVAWGGLASVLYLALCVLGAALALLQVSAPR